MHRHIHTVSYTHNHIQIRLWAMLTDGHIGRSQTQLTNCCFFRFKRVQFFFPFACHSLWKVAIHAQLHVSELIFVLIFCLSPLVAVERQCEPLFALTHLFPHPHHRRAVYFVSSLARNLPDVIVNVFISLVRLLAPLRFYDPLWCLCLCS